MNRPTLAELEKQARDWNAKHPVGTAVIRYKLINPLKDGCATCTRSEAWVMGGHSVMVMVSGVSGGVLLQSVVPVVDLQPDTPLTDSVSIEFPFPTPSDRQLVVHADNCREIEGRLNKCVEALEVYLMAGHKDARRDASIQAKEAIERAKEPLV